MNRLQATQQSVTKLKRNSLPNQSLSYRAGPYMLKNSSINGTIDKALELKNSQVSIYSKDNLLYPSVDKSRLNEEQLQLVQGYVQEIKLLDNELNKKSIIKAAKMIDIKPYIDNK